MNAAVIIPAYNPDEKLKAIVDRVWDLENLIIVVDDGSDMSKSDIFHQLTDKAIVIHHEKNMGKGTAIKTALSYIAENLPECDVVGVMDADGQHLPEDMEKLLMKAHNKEHAMVLGVRSLDANMPFKSRIGNVLTAGIFRLVSGIRVSDTQTGLRAFSADLIGRLSSIDGSRYEYETNVLLNCAKEGVPIVEVPVRTIYHDKENTCSHFRLIGDSFRIYRDIIKFSMSSFSSFVLDYVLFCFLTLLFPAGALGIFWANIIARVISGGYNYLMNCRFVFHTRAKLKTASQYLILAVGILFFNSIFLQVYTGVFDIDAYIAKILTELSLFIISFLVQKKMIFSRKSIKKEMIKI